MARPTTSTAHTDEIGELGDHALNTRQGVNLAVDTPEEPEAFRDDLFKLFKPFITLHSAENKNAYVEAAVDPSAVAAPRPLESHEKRAGHLKLDFAHATAEEIADVLRKNWGLESPMLEFKFQADEEGSGEGRNDETMFARGLQLEGITIRFEDPALHDGFASPVRFLGEDGLPMLDFNNEPVPFKADGYLRALQIGANVVDSRDSDHARTEVTHSVNDEWWDYRQDPNADNVTHRAIDYTIAGNEGIRINEIMVRPVAPRRS